MSSQHIRYLIQPSLFFTFCNAEMHTCNSMRLSVLFNPDRDFQKRIKTTGPGNSKIWRAVYKMRPRGREATVVPGVSELAELPAAEWRPAFLLRHLANCMNSSTLQRVIWFTQSTKFNIHLIKNIAAQTFLECLIKYPCIMPYANGHLKLIINT